MRFTNFKIKNFKGIEEIELNIISKPLSNIIPLVGINESGKTTAENCKMLGKKHNRIKFGK